MPRISGRSSAVGAKLARREPFTTHGALSAVDVPPTSTGRLPSEWAQLYRADLIDPGVRYVVLSFTTPIAWERADGVLVLPGESYSRTTSRHQGIARRWL